MLSNWSNVCPGSLWRTSRTMTCFQVVSRHTEHHAPCTFFLFLIYFLSPPSVLCIKLIVDCLICCVIIHCESEKKLDFFHLSITLANNSFTVTDENYLLRNIIICNWICNFTYTLLLHNLEKCNHIHFFTENFE